MAAVVGNGRGAGGGRPGTGSLLRVPAATGSFLPPSWLPFRHSRGRRLVRSHTHERRPKVDEEQVSLTTVLKALNAFERGGDRVSVIFRKKKEDLPSRKKQNLEE